MATVLAVLLSMDGAIYNLICYVFEIFYYLCGLQLFNDSDYNSIVQTIYVILGLVMMFVLAYSLLRAVINPDEFAKGETSFPKLIQNVIVSLIIIAVLPMVFNATFSIQNSLLNYEVIPKLILGTNTTTDGTGPNVEVEEADNVSGGRAIAFYTFKAFLVPNVDSGKLDCEGSAEECRSAVKGNGTWGATNGDALTDIDSDVIKGKTFEIYSTYSESIRDQKLTYYFPISTVAGIFILYVLLNFCFDMALRVIKLAFYQIIAPIPVICRIIPGGKLKDVFSKWVKQVVSLFVEVFVRVGALSFGVYLIGLVINKFETGLDGIDMLNQAGQKAIVLALLIMSIVMFVKEIPKIIGDMFGLDTGGMKLGLMDKLAAGGALTAGAIAGGALGSLGRNTVSAIKNVKDAKKGEKLGAFGRGLLSMGAGAVSGARRGFSAGKGAKNFGDMKKAASTAVEGASAAKAKRDAYRASHQREGFGETLLNVGLGHMMDKAHSVGEYFGIGDDLSSLNATQAVYQEGMGFKKKLFELASDNEKVLAYQGMKKNAQEKDISNYVNDIEKDIKSRGFANSDNTGYYKINASGQKEYFKDATGNVIKDLTSLAIEQKTAEIKKYDDAIKLASLNTIYDKINSGDDRYKAVLDEFKTWQDKNANIDGVVGLSAFENLNSSQMDAINSALSSNDKDSIKLVLDALEGDSSAMSQLGISSLGIMKNDKDLKKLNGNVQRELAKKIQEKNNDKK